MSKNHHHPPHPTAPLKRDNLLPLLYAMDQEHGWSQGMRAITHALLGATRLPPGSAARSRQRVPSAEAESQADLQIVVWA